jgi:hypothetical protein
MLGMKTLEERAKELGAEQHAKEMAAREQADRESRLAHILATDIEKHAAKISVPLTAKIDGNRIVVASRRGTSAEIKVVSDGQGSESFAFTSANINMVRGTEDEVLKAILDWFRT